MQMNKMDEGTVKGWVPVWLKGQKFFWAVGAGLYMVVFSAWLLLKWTDPALETLIANLGYLPLGFFSAITAFYASSQKQVGQRTQRAWQFIAAGLFAMVIGDIAYTILDVTRGVGFPDLPDIFYLAFYPLAFIGLISIPTKVSDPFQKKTWRQLCHPAGGGVPPYYHGSRRRSHNQTSPQNGVIGWQPDGSL